MCGNEWFMVGPLSSSRQSLPEMGKPLRKSPWSWNVKNERDLCRWGESVYAMGIWRTCDKKDKVCTTIRKRPYSRSWKHGEAEESHGGLCNSIAGQAWKGISQLCSLGDGLKGGEWTLFLLGDSCLQAGDDGDSDYSASSGDGVKGREARSSMTSCWC